MPYTYWSAGGGSTGKFYLRDSQGTPHYWEANISSTGVLTWVDVGTAAPSGVPLSEANLNGSMDAVRSDANVDATALVNTHLADAVGAHAASAISFTSGAFAASTVQDALDELVDTVDFTTKTANYTLALADAGYVVVMDNTSAAVVTFPNNSTVAFPVGTSIEILRKNTGAVTFAAAAGVTLDPTTVALDTRLDSVAWLKTATNTWVATGFQAGGSTVSLPWLDSNEYGLDPTGTVDNATELQTLLNDHAASGQPILFRPGTYRSSAGLTCSAPFIAIQGSPGDNTTAPTTSKIVFDSSTTYDLLTVGPGATGSGSRPGGFIRDLVLEGVTNAATGGFAGLKLNGLRHVLVENVRVDKMDIGFDAVNNCFGSSWENCRTGLGGTVNVGINFRAGSQSGNDLTMQNCWFHGRTAAVHIANNSGGIHIRSGQLSSGSGLGSIQDGFGAVTLGKDYLTSSTGSHGAVNLDGVDFENVNYMWVVRAYGTGSVQLSNCALLGTASNLAIGAWKGTVGSVSFINTFMSASWSSASTAMLTPTFANSAAIFTEIGTRANGNITCNSVAYDVTSKPLAIEAGVAQCFVVSGLGSRGVIWLGATGIRPSSTSGALEVSTDKGTTWLGITPLTGSVTWDPAAINAANQVTNTVTVTGAAVGDPVSVGFTQDLQAMQLTGYVSATNTVTVVLRNGTAGSINLGSGTLTAKVTKQ